MPWTRPPRSPAARARDLAALAERHARYPDAQIRALLNTTRTIALVGLGEPGAPDWIVLKYLLDRGYAVTPVNPGLAGQDLLGRRWAASLAEVQASLGDRRSTWSRSSAIPPPPAAGRRGAALSPPPKVIWMQLGGANDAAAARAEARGLTVIMNRAAKIEYGRSRRDRLDRREFPDPQRPETGAGGQGRPEADHRGAGPRGD